MPTSTATIPWAYDQRGFDYIVRDKMGYASEIDHQIFGVRNRDKFERVIMKPAANDNYLEENGAAYVRDAYVHTPAIVGGLDLDSRTSESCVLYVNGNYWGVYRNTRESGRQGLYRTVLFRSRRRHPVPENLGLHVV